MFSRTKALFSDFVKVLKEAPVNKIFITDIYPAREIDTGLVNSKELVDSIDEDSVSFIPKDQILEKIKQEINSGQIIFFLGAGDINEIAKEFVA
jgi:UDP-N-acetylmuramate--alanine ligase